MNILTLSLIIVFQVYFFSLHSMNFEKIKKTRTCQEFKSGKLNFLKKELDKIHGINEPYGNTGLSPLCVACMSDNFDMVKWLVEEKKADINYRSGEFKISPLHCACNEDCFEIVDYLLKKGADIDILDTDNQPPMSRVDNNWMSMHFRKVIAKSLANKGALLNYKNSFLLHAACISRDLETVTFFVERGADVNAVWYDKTPLYISTIKSGREKNNCFDVIKFLIKHGAETSILRERKILDKVLISKLKKESELDYYVQKLKNQIESSIQSDIADLLKEITWYMFYEDVPIYTKQIAIPVLIEVSKKFPKVYSQNKLSQFFNTIIFNYTFLKSPAFTDAVTWAYTHKYRDIFGRSILEAAVVCCNTEDRNALISNIFECDSVTYNSNRLFTKFITYDRLYKKLYNIFIRGIYKFLSSK